MSALLAEDFVSLAEAASIFEDTLYSGTTEHSEVVRYRKSIDQDLRDRNAGKQASAALWEAVDRGHLAAWAIGGTKQLRLTGEIVSNIPMLRETGGLRYLRSRTPAHKEINAWFGPNLANVHIAFRLEQVRQSAKRILRNRRAAERRLSVKPLGRRSSHTDLAPLVEKLIDDNKWKTSEPIKKLTQLLNRLSAVQKVVSEDTVTRVLKRLHEERKDRKFLRLERERSKKDVR